MYPTGRQKEVYDFIAAYIRRRGAAPSYEEIRVALGLASLSTVHKHLKCLEKRGFLRSPWGSNKRAIELVGENINSVALPLLGYVAAGKPIEAIESPDAIDVPPGLLKGGECFALKVRGDSMIEEGIHDGDTIIVRRQATADVGQTVVAVIDGEATVKKYYPSGSKIELRPANAAMKSIVADADSVEIRGVVIGLIRSY